MPEPAEGRQVLVIEDDEALAESLRKVLATRGLDVDWAPTAARARRLLDSDVPSLVILDLGLPDADGRVVLSEIRSYPRLASMPVIVLTGRHSEMIRRECLALGADGFLEKPFELDEMLGKIEEVFAAPPRSTARERPSKWLPEDEDMPTALQERYEHWRRLAEDGFPVALAVMALEAAGTDPRRRPVPEEAVEGLMRELEGTTRHIDEMIRLAGAQATMLLPATDVSGARRAVDRIRRRLGEVGAPALDDAGLHVVVAAGVTDVRPDGEPRAALREARRSQHLSPAHPARAAPTAPVQARVLLVEDDHITATLIRDRLEREGHHVTVSVDGASAMEHLDEHTPDLMVLDLELPGVGGFEVLRRVRESGGPADLSVIVLTSLGRERDATRAFDMGASDYMVKPLSSAELLARVERLLASPD